MGGRVWRRRGFLSLNKLQKRIGALTPPTSFGPSIDAVPLPGLSKPCSKNAVTMRSPAVSNRTAASCYGGVADVDPHPPGPQQRCGICFRHLDRAVGGHVPADA